MLSHLSAAPAIKVVSVGIGLLLIRRLRSWIHLAYHTLGRDLSFIFKMGRVFGSLMLMQRRGVTIPDLFRKQVGWWTYPWRFDMHWYIMIDHAIDSHVHAEYDCSYSPTLRSQCWYSLTPVKLGHFKMWSSFQTASPTFSSMLLYCKPFYAIIKYSRATIFQLARSETRRCCGHLHDLATHVYCHTDGAGKDRSDLELDQLQLDWRGETPVRWFYHTNNYFINFTESGPQHQCGRVLFNHLWPGDAG